MKALIVGADGSIGVALAQALLRRGDLVYGTTRRQSLVTQTRPFLDLATPDVDTIPLPDTDIAFFCAGITTFAECRANRATARQVNVVGRASIARRLAAAGTRVVLLSTSAVFDGHMSHVPPSCPTCPVTAYGEFAAEAEKLFGALGSIASIVRFAKVMMPGAKRFISWIDDLSQGKMITAFSDLCMAPISLDDAIAALLAVADDPAGGICQVSGTTDINYYDAACYFASRLGVDSALVVEKCASDAGIPAEEIPRFSSLDTQRFTELTGRLAPEPHALIDYVFGEEFKLKGRRRHSAQSGN